MSNPKLLLLTLPAALLAAATPPAGSRLAAMQAAYDEGRWVGGADDAACSSGWSDVPTGQGRAAAARLVWLVRQFLSCTGPHAGVRENRAVISVYRYSI